MVDMHIHSNYSDGDKNIKELLEVCEERKLDYISITDHNTCEQYNDEGFKLDNIFSGKIIKGVELNAVFGNRNIEILGYNVDINIINEWRQKYYSEEYLNKQQKICGDILLEICDKKRLIYDKSIRNKHIPVNDFIEIHIYEELMKHEENYNILGKLTESGGIFYRKGLANPESDFFINRNEFRPKYKEVIDIIHASGGKAFLAHPFEYKFLDTIKFIDELRKETELDGIECFHPSSEDDNKKDILVKYARKNNLFISGGSDFHGKRKANIEIGYGKGSLNISKEFIEEWIN